MPWCMHPPCPEDVFGLTTDGWDGQNPGHYHAAVFAEQGRHGRQGGRCQRPRPLYSKSAVLLLVARTACSFLLLARFSILDSRSCHLPACPPAFHDSYLASSTRTRAGPPSSSQNQQNAQTAQPPRPPWYRTVNCRRRRLVSLHPDLHPPAPPPRHGPSHEAHYRGLVHGAVAVACVSFGVEDLPTAITDPRPRPCGE